MAHLEEDEVSAVARRRQGRISYRAVALSLWFKLMVMGAIKLRSIMFLLCFRHWEFGTGFWETTGTTSGVASLCVSTLCNLYSKNSKHAG